MRIAVIGTGAMGSRLARRLLDGSLEVIVWNRTAARTGPLVAAGAIPAATPAEAAASADHVITMLADGNVVLDVVSSPDGLAAGLRPGQTLIEMSTVAPTHTRRLPDLVPPGVEIVDAPVLGSISEAEAGTLRIFVGGTDEAFASVRPVLELVGRPTHIGPFTSGARLKLAANAALLGTLAVLGEIVALADREGLDRDAVFDVLSSTPLASQAARRRPVVEGQEVPVRFRLALAAKDAELITAEGDEVGVELPVLQATAAWFRRAAEHGPADGDYSTVVRHIGEPPHDPAP